MAIVPLSQPESDPRPVPSAPASNSVNWVRVSAACFLGAGGALLLGGQRRAGLLAAATGTTLAMLDQQHTLHDWWKVLPVYIGEVQRLLSQVQGSVDSLAAQRDKLESFLRK